MHRHEGAEVIVSIESTMGGGAGLIAHHSRLLGTRAIAQRRWNENVRIYRQWGVVNMHFKSEHIRALQVVEHLQAVPDTVETLIWPLRCEVEHILRLGRRNLLAHDLTRKDLEELERRVGLPADLGQHDLWLRHWAAERLLEVLLLDRDGCQRSRRNKKSPKYVPRP